MAQNQSQQNKITQYLLITFLLIYPLLFVFQGLDFTDMGFVLTNQYQTLVNPTSVHYRFFTWLSNLIGGGILHLVDPYGILGSKFAAVLSYYVIMICVYILLKQYLPKRNILFGLALAVMFIIKDTGTWFNYNKLTALFFIIAVVLLFEGENKKQPVLVFLGAFVLGINIFVRLPNLLGILFIFSGIFFYWLDKKYNLISFVVVFLLGYLTGIIFCLLLLKFTRHYDLFFSSLHEYLSMKNTSGSSHSSGALVLVLLRDYSLSSVLGLGALAVTITFVHFLQPVSKTFRYLLYTLTIILGAIILSKGDLWKWIYFVPILLVLITYSLNLRSANTNLRLISLLALILMIIVPLGSNNGVYNSIYGMWLSIPIGTHFILTTDEFRIRRWNFNHTNLREVKVLIFGITILSSLVIGYRGTYRDSNNRLKMTSSVDNPRLAGVFTTKARAKVTEELLTHLSEYSKPGDYILAYDGMALVYYLTKTQPYLANPWPLLYSASYLREELEKAQENIQYLPIIVRPKGSTFTTSWPSQISAYRDKYATRRPIIGSFMKMHAYKRIWQNEFFEIFKSDDSE